MTQYKMETEANGSESSWHFFNFRIPDSNLVFSLALAKTSRFCSVETLAKSLTCLSSCGLFCHHAI